MSEKQSSTWNKEITFSERFSNACMYWKQAIEEGRASKTEFYAYVFDSPETEIYQEMANDESLMLIARTLNETWVGNTVGFGRVDTHNR